MLPTAAFIFTIVALVAYAPVALSAEQRSFTDSAGRNITVPAKIERVYAAGPPASVMVYALAPDKLIGWTRALKPDERAFLPDLYANLPELGRLTGRGNTANVEVVLKHRPDVIVDAGSVAATYSSLADRVQEQTRIPYILLDGTLAKTAQTFRALGRLLGEEARAEVLAGYVEKSLSEIEQKISAVPLDKRPRVYYGRGPDGLQTGLEGSINVEALEFLGAHNVAVEPERRGGLATVSLEQVLHWDPDVIVTVDPHFRAALLTDPRWASVSAVRNKRIHLSPHLPFGWFDFPPGPNRLIGLQWLAKALYPDLFDYDLRARAMAFYRLFYHREPTAEQLDFLFWEAAIKP
jgi:iron complex transport system substrate-binding protein